MQSTELVTRLYQAVDSRTAASLEPFLSPSVTFQLGNNLPVSGKEAVLQVNASFFESVAAMAHTASFPETGLSLAQCFRMRSTGSWLVVIRRPLWGVSRTSN